MFQFPGYNGNTWHCQAGLHGKQVRPRIGSLWQCRIKPCPPFRPPAWSPESSQVLLQQIWRGSGVSCKVQRRKVGQDCAELPSRAAEVNRTSLNHLQFHLLTLIKERVLELNFIGSHISLISLPGAFKGLNVILGRKNVTT